LKILLVDSEQARDAKGQTSKSEKQRKAEEDLHPLEFNLTVSNTNGTKTRFNNFIEPTFNPITPSRGQTVMPERIQEDEPLRKSVLVKDSSQSYETRRRLVKSVLQRLDTGNIYQKANDLLDSALIMFSKRFDADMQAALQQLKDLIISFDEALPVDSLEDLVKLIFTQMHENDSAGASQTLGDLEKVFINSFYDFMPDYLGRNKSIKIAGSEKKKLAKELEMPIDLEKLRQDNEKLKKDVWFLKEQKLSLEKIIQ
jgi:hypothetical protein